ncbi:MAG: hypothetical protein M1331_03600 [Candidatus Marsarchaeota archaeon]|nr:hypothetical protein [Candidatus Marsarchaeota archaeon]MCL5106452.1 hypothetical protein [Candidatus Marsarchaeota archaeon]
MPVNSEIVFLFMYDTGSTFETEQLNGILKNQEDFSKYEYQKPGPEEISTFNIPLIFNLRDESVFIDGIRYLLKVQVSLYVFGAFSVRIRYSFSGSYEQLAKLTFSKRLNEFVNAAAARAKRKVIAALGKIAQVKESTLSERYRFYYIDADKHAVLRDSKKLIAGLLIDEDKTSTLEKGYVESVLRKNITYDTSSIFFVGWESAIIIDKGYVFEHELLMAEIANVELLETRIQHRLLVEKLKNANKALEKLSKDRMSLLKGRKLGRLSESLARSYEASRMILNNVEDTAYGYGEWYLSRVYGLFYDVFKLSNIEAALEKDIDAISNERMLVDDMIALMHEDFLEYIIILLILIEVLIEFIYLFK